MYDTLNNFRGCVDSCIFGFSMFTPSFLEINIVLFHLVEQGLAANL